MSDIESKVNSVENQKDFAIAINSLCYKHVLFMARKANISAVEALNSLKPTMKAKTFKAYYDSCL